MSDGEAKLAEVAKKNTENENRVEEIFREAEEVEGEVQQIIRRFTRRVGMYRAQMAIGLERSAKPAASTDGGE